VDGYLGSRVKRHTRVVVLLSVLPILCCGSATAGSFSVRGGLALSDGSANDTLAYEFAVLTTSTVVIQSYGYGGSTNAPGGRNLAGARIPAGGFDPYLSLFAGAGPGATFLASNDDGACPPAAPDNGLCADSRLTLSLTPGKYTVVVSAFENMSLSENTGAGTLGDGFIGLGNYDALRSTNYAIDIGASGIDELFRDSFE
jgi:hypothetical protein